MSVESQVFGAVDSRRRSDFVSAVIRDGGGSMSVYGGVVPSSGFMVSVARAERVIPWHVFSVLGVDAVRRFECENAGLLARDGAFLGAWVNGGDVYLDVSFHFVDEFIARAQGVAEKQLAIFDLGDGREITL